MTDPRDSRGPLEPDAVNSRTSGSEGAGGRQRPPATRLPLPQTGTAGSGVGHGRRIIVATGVRDVVASRHIDDHHVLAHASGLRLEQPVITAPSSSALISPTGREAIALLAHGADDRVLRDQGLYLTCAEARRARLSPNGLVAIGPRTVSYEDSVLAWVLAQMVRILKGCSIDEALTAHLARGRAVRISLRPRPCRTPHARAPLALSCPCTRSSMSRNRGVAHVLMPSTRLTPAEIRVLSALAEGLGTVAALTKLVIGLDTFNRTLRNIGDKQHRYTRASKVHAAYLSGELPLPDSLACPEISAEDRKLWVALAAQPDLQATADAVHLSRVTTNERINDLVSRFGAHSESHLVTLGHAYGLFETTATTGPAKGMSR